MAVRNRRSLLFRGDRVGANAIGSGSPWWNGKIHEADTGRYWPGSDVYGGPPSFFEKALNVSWLAPVFKRVYECVTGLGCWRQHTCPKDGYLDCSMLCHWIILEYEIQIESLHISLRPGNGICERKSGTTWKITTWLTFLGLFITAFRISKDLQRLVNAWPSCRSSSTQRWSKLTQTPRRNPLELQPYGQERSFSCKKTLRKVGWFPCKDLVLHKQFGQIPKGKWHAAFAAAGLSFKSCFLWYDMRVEYSSIILHVSWFTVSIK